MLFGKRSYVKDCAGVDTSEFVRIPFEKEKNNLLLSEGVSLLLSYLVMSCIALSSRSMTACSEGKK
jgi:hypothetical protein